MEQDVIARDGSIDGVPSDLRYQAARLFQVALPEALLTTGSD